MTELPLSLKRGVRARGLRPEALLGIVIVAGVYEAHGVPCVVTSITDGTHSRASLHYQGAAFDVRTHTVPPDLLGQVADACRGALGIDYDVVLEPTHMHVEYQPKTG